MSPWAIKMPIRLWGLSFFWENKIPGRIFVVFGGASDEPQTNRTPPIIFLKSWVRSLSGLSSKFSEKCSSNFQVVAKDHFAHSVFTKAVIQSSSLAKPNPQTSSDLSIFSRRSKKRIPRNFISPRRCSKTSSVQTSCIFFDPLRNSVQVTWPHERRNKHFALSLYIRPTSHPGGIRASHSTDLATTWTEFVCGQEVLTCVATSVRSLKDVCHLTEIWKHLSGGRL